MAEDKVLTFNLRKKLENSASSERKGKFIRKFQKNILKHAKGKKVRIDMKLNEKIWSGKLSKIRVKLRTENNKVVVELME